MVVVRASKQSATYADIEALPDDVIGEIVAGELFVSPRPGIRTRVPHRHCRSS